MFIKKRSHIQDNNTVWFHYYEMYKEVKYVEAQMRFQVVQGWEWKNQWLKKSTKSFLWRKHQKIKLRKRVHSSAHGSELFSLCNLIREFYGMLITPSQSCSEKPNEKYKQGLQALPVHQAGRETKREWDSTELIAWSVVSVLWLFLLRHEELGEHCSMSGMAPWKSHRTVGKPTWVEFTRPPPGFATFKKSF